MTYQIEKTWVLCTHHVSKETAFCLETADYPYVKNKETGWQIYVRGAKTTQHKDLKTLVEIAQKMGCRYILFTVDGPQEDDLESFGW